MTAPAPAPANGPGTEEGATPPAGGPAPSNGSTSSTAPPNGEPATGDPAKPDEDATDWKSKSRTWEDRAKENRKVAEQATAAQQAADERLAAVLKAAGIADADEDPTEAAKKATAERDAKDAELRTLRIDSAAEKAGRKAGADVDALTDSRAFATAAAKLDPSSGTFADDMAELVTKALADNPRLKATPAGPAATPSTEMGGGGEPPAGGAKSIDQIRKERRERRSR